MQTPFHGIHRGGWYGFSEVAGEELRYTRADIAVLATRTSEVGRDAFDDMGHVEQATSHLWVCSQDACKECTRSAADVNKRLSRNVFEGIVNGETKGLCHGTRAQSLVELAHEAFLGEVVEKIHLGLVLDLRCGTVLSDTHGIWHGTGDIEEVVPV